ncbi:MAG: pyruvate carboxylase subunit B [Rubrivivax sp.]
MTEPLKPMKFMDITLRDAQQCLWATRMRTSEMTPIARTIDAAGFSVVDLTGGAAMDTAMMFLAEDPFERVRTLAGLMPNSRLNFNTRGQSIFRWMQYGDDVIEFTLALMQRNGIRSIMAFDALNDLRNIEHTVAVARRLGLYVIGAVVYASSPVHTVENFAQKVRELVAMGVDTIEIKDSCGILTPAVCETLLPAVREAAQGLEVQLHSHCTTGHGVDVYRKALEMGERGVDLFHCASRPLAYGFSLPSYHDVLDLLPQYGFRSTIDRAAVDEMEAYFTMLTRRSGRPPGEVQPMQEGDLGHQAPGGMLSNLIQQLKDQGQEHRLQEVLAEIGRVREDLGYPIIVSPMAQYVGTQAVLNVLCGERYQIVPQEIKQYVLGYYGAKPGTVDPKVRELIAGDEEGITVRPGETIPPMMERYRRELQPYASDEELALKIFYSAKTVEDNRIARMNVRRWTHATNPASLLARELLGRGNLEICEVRKKDFYFSIHDTPAAPAQA